MYEPVIGLMLVIHNGASTPLILEVYFIICTTCWLQPKILSPIHCEKKQQKNTWQPGNVEIMCTLFFCFGWPQREEEMVRLVAMQGNDLITTSVFV